MGSTPTRSLESVDSIILHVSRLKLLPLDGRVHFLVNSWSNNYYLGFQSAVLAAIRAA
jgi:hypothetical protein